MYTNKRGSCFRRSMTASGNNNNDDEVNQSDTEGETLYEKVHDVIMEIVMYSYVGAFTIFFITVSLGLSVLVACGIIKLIQMMFI